MSLNQLVIMRRLLHNQVGLVVALIGLQVIIFEFHLGAACPELKKNPKIKFFGPLLKKIRTSEAIKSSFSQIGGLVLNTVSGKTLKLLTCLGAPDCQQPAEKDPEPEAPTTPTDASLTEEVVTKTPPAESSSEASFELYDDELFYDSGEKTEAPTNVGSAPKVSGKSKSIPSTQTTEPQTTSDHGEAALISLLKNAQFKLSIPINIVNNPQPRKQIGKTKPSTYKKSPKVITVYSHDSEPMTYDYIESAEQTIDYSYESFT